MEVEMKRKPAELEHNRQGAKRFYELPVVDAETLTAHRDHHIRIRAYMNRFTAQLPDLLEGSEITFALFDPDGCLLKLFSNQRAQQRLTACGVTVGTLWSRKAAGENAVSQGLDPSGEEGRAIARLHREWLCFSWTKYTPQAHRGLAQMYTADPRFTAYYDRDQAGCAAFLKAAIEAEI